MYSAYVSITSGLIVAQSHIQFNFALHAVHVRTPDFVAFIAEEGLDYNCSRSFHCAANFETCFTDIMDQLCVCAYNKCFVYNIISVVC